MYYALYRKYRPKDFNSVVGQDIIVRTLKNSIINNNFSHAYMFFGPRGTGKTTVSKIFAKSINCLENKDGCSCGKCKMCNISYSKECVDIIEIDAASNNGVDEIRELKNNINLVPSGLKFKVYIIDEVHMLSIGAFNALLKTLEEPPEHVIFILATTDPQKVPETIISRCQCFSFKRISNDDIEKRLSYVCKQEKIEIEDEVIKKIAILSDGGLRDALGMLDKLISYTDSKITIDILNDVNGIVSDDELYSFIKYISEGDINNVLLLIDKFNSCGKNIIQILIQLINYLRDYIVDYYLEKKESNISIDLLQKLINVLNEKLFDIKKSSLPKIYIETIILKFINDNVLINSNNELSNITSNTNIHNDSKNTSLDVLVVDNNEVADNKVNIIDSNNNHNNNAANDNNYSNTSEKVSVDDSINDNDKILNIDDVMSARINNTFATATKGLLSSEKKFFDLLKDYSFDQEIGSLVNTLLDSNLRACGKNNFIISYESNAIVEQNILDIKILNDVYNKITNSNKTFAIVTDDKWENLKKEYINHLNNNIKYEIIDEPELLFEETKNNDIISSSAVDLFGEDIVEIE